MGAYVAYVTLQHTGGCHKASMLPLEGGAQTCRSIVDALYCIAIETSNVCEHTLSRYMVHQHGVSGPSCTNVSYKGTPTVVSYYAFIF